jgi:hypothetical protein
LIGLNKLPAFIVYPNTNIYFDFEVSGLPKQFPVIEHRHFEDFGNVVLIEEYVINLNHGTVIGADISNDLKNEYEIHLTENIYLIVNSSIFYISAKMNEFVIAVLRGNITYMELDESPKIITANQIAEIFLDSQEFMTIQNLNNNEEITNLLHKIRDGDFYE